MQIQKLWALLSLPAILAMPRMVRAESVATDYPYDVFAKNQPQRALTTRSQTFCKPDLVVSVQIFVHDSVNDGNAWDAAGMKKVKDRMAPELNEVNQAYCDPTIGALKTQFTFTYTFLTNDDFAVAGIKLLDVLSSFGDFWKSGVYNNGSDMGLIYVVNPDGYGGWSPVGPDVSFENGNGGPALNWAWENKGEVIAHEVGHFFGASHDGSDSSANCPAQGDIMGGGVTLTWSTCSQASIQGWLNSSKSFYFKNSRQWLTALDRQGPLGGNGGSPFITGCKDASVIEKVQAVTGNVGGRPSIVDLRYACSDGFSTIQGTGNVVTINPKTVFTAYAHTWLSGLGFDGQTFGSTEGYQGAIACAPDTRIAGFFGRRGSALDQIGLFCTKDPANVGPFGGAGTINAYDFTCNAGEQVKDILVRTGDVVGYPSITDIGIECTDGTVQTLRQDPKPMLHLPMLSPAQPVRIHYASWIQGIGAKGIQAGPQSGLQTKSFACPAHRKLKGIFGSSGSAIDTLGLHCESDI